MSEDRLERALRDMQDEPVSADTIDAARRRVWQTLADADTPLCAQFSADFATYLANGLTGSRRMLLEDHLSRCPACRARVAELKGDRKVVPMPRRSARPR